MGIRKRVFIKVLFQYIPDPFIGDGITIDGTFAGIVKPLGTI